MVKRTPKKILPTMKIDADSNNELDISFKECQAKIIGVEDVKTKKYGDKVKINLENQEDDKQFSVFANNYTIENLNNAYGDDDEEWINKLVDLKQETDKQYNSEMIVLHAVK